MVQQAADVVASHVRQAAVAGLVVEQRLAVLPQRLVGVHARAVVAEERLRHEGHGLACVPRGVLDQVLEQHQVVGGVQQRVELVVDLGLARGADLVVAALDLEARRDQVGDHVVAQVGVVVDRRHREVAALVVDLVAEVAAVLLAAGVPPALDGVDVVVALVRIGAEAHRVEDVELGLGAEVAGVGDAGRREVLLRLARDVARVAAVGLARDRVVHEEVDVERLVLAERVQPRGGGVGEQRHVGLVDGLEAADGRAVERDAVLQDVGCVEAGTVRCCITPGRSQKRMSRYSTFSSEMNLRTSSELLNTLACSFDRLVGSSDAMAGMLPVGHSMVSQRLTASRPVAAMLLQPRLQAMTGWLESWMPGTTIGPNGRTDSGYPGERLGLPAAGVGSAAGFGRRLAALTVDWFIGYGIAAIFATPDPAVTPGSGGSSSVSGSS